VTAFLSLSQAIEEHVRDGATVALEGFTHLIPDNAFCTARDLISRDRDAFLAWMQAKVIATGSEAAAKPALAR
jgi:acyl CoA:acetate/3-ketoacid CoA transferase alpha subunit